MNVPFNAVDEALAQNDAPVTPVALSASPGARGPLDQVRVINAQTGVEQYLSPEEANAAFKAGQVNLPDDTPIGFLDADGTPRTGDAAKANAAVAAGGALIPHAVAHHAELAHEYSGAKGGAIAFGAGLGRGATLGLSDMAIHGLGGDEAAEAVEAANEEHPWLKAGGELGGMAAGAAFVPGMGLADLAGEEGAAGLARLTGGALSKGAEGLGSRMLARGAEGLISGSAYGLQQGLQTAISEAALHTGLDQNPDLTGEQLVDGLGHDIVLGAIFGGLAGAGAEAAGTGLKKAASFAQEKLGRIANSEMWRDINSGKGITKQAMARVEGGTDALGQTAREIGLDDPRLSLPAQLEKATAAKEDVGSQIGDAYRQSGATGTARELVDRLDGLISDADQIAGNGTTVNALKEYRASLLDKLAKSAVDDGSATAEDVAKMVRDPREQTLLDEIDRLRAAGAPPAQLDELEKFRFASFGPSAVAEAPKVPASLLDAPVPIADMWRQRVGLNRLVYQEAKALDPKLRVELLRTFSGRFQDYLEEVGEKAAQETGGTFAAPLRELNQKYQHLSLIEDALEEKTARYLTNRRYSLTDSIAGGGGMAGAGGMLIAGHPLVAAGMLASGFANKFLREKAPQIAAYVTGRVGSLEGLAAHAERFDQLVERTASVLGSKSATPPPSLPPATPAKRSEADTREAYDEKAGMVRALAEHPQTGPSVDEHFQPLAGVAPKTAAAAAAATKARIDYLARNLPPPLPLDPLRPELTAPPSLGDQQRWLRRYEATPETLLAQLATLRLDPLTLETVRETAPNSYGKIVSAAHARLAADPAAFDRPARLSLARLTGGALTPGGTPAAAAASQAVYTTPPAPQGMGSGSKSDKGMQRLSASRATATERLSKGD